MLPSRLVDTVFAWLFRAFSFTAFAALGAIALFIFIQGAEPFFKPTAKSIRIVTERFEKITINGIVYESPEGFIELPWDTETITVLFAGLGASVDGKEQELIFRLSPGKNYRTELAETIVDGEGSISSGDAYTYSVVYPGALYCLR